MVTEIFISWFNFLFKLMCTIIKIIYRCVPVPTGVCTVTSETGYHIANFHNASFVSLTLADILANKNLGLECKSVILTIVCDYFFQPCNQDTGHLVSVCESSCPVLEGILEMCFPLINDSLESEQLHSVFRTFNCSDPSSYLLKGVPIEETICRNLTYLGI